MSNDTDEIYNYLKYLGINFINDFELSDKEYFEKIFKNSFNSIEINELKTDLKESKTESFNLDDELKTDLKEFNLDDELKTESFNLDDELKTEEFNLNKHKIDLKELEIDKSKTNLKVRGGDGDDKIDDDELDDMKINIDYIANDKTKSGKYHHLKCNIKLIKDDNNNRRYIFDISDLGKKICIFRYDIYFPTIKNLNNTFEDIINQFRCYIYPTHDEIQIMRYDNMTADEKLNKMNLEVNECFDKEINKFKSWKKYSEEINSDVYSTIESYIEKSKLETICAINFILKSIFFRLIIIYIKTKLNLCYSANNFNDIYNEIIEQFKNNYFENIFWNFNDKIINCKNEELFRILNIDNDITLLDANKFISNSRIYLGGNGECWLNIFTCIVYGQHYKDNYKIDYVKSNEQNIINEYLDLFKLHPLYKERKVTKEQFDCIINYKCLTSVCMLQFMKMTIKSYLEECHNELIKCRDFKEYVNKQIKRKFIIYNYSTKMRAYYSEYIDLIFSYYSYVCVDANHHAIYIKISDDKTIEIYDINNLYRYMTIEVIPKENKHKYYINNKNNEDMKRLYLSVENDFKSGNGNYIISKYTHTYSNSSSPKKRTITIYICNGKKYNKPCINILNKYYTNHKFICKWYNNDKKENETFEFDYDINTFIVMYNNDENLNQQYYLLNLGTMKTENKNTNEITYRFNNADANLLRLNKLNVITRMAPEHLFYNTTFNDCTIPILQPEVVKAKHVAYFKIEIIPYITKDFDDVIDYRGYIPFEFNRTNSKQSICIDYGNNNYTIEVPEVKDLDLIDDSDLKYVLEDDSIDGDTLFMPLNEKFNIPIPYKVEGGNSKNIINYVFYIFIILLIIIIIVIIIRKMILNKKFINFTIFK